MMLSIRANWKHAALEHQIREIDPAPDLTRPAILTRAIYAARNLPAGQWQEVQKRLSTIPRLEIQPPATMQARLDEDASAAYEEVRTAILSACDLKVLQTQYAWLLLSVNYLEQLKRKKMEIGAERRLEDGAMTGPEMMASLTQILLLNRAEDAGTIAKIRKILTEWRNSQHGSDSACIYNSRANNERP